MSAPRPVRLRRSQLAVPGSAAALIAKAAASAADHVFCDLEDAVAPSEKAAARGIVVEALNGLDWGGKTRCVRINDTATSWCFEDVIAIVEGAGGNLDTIMLPKARGRQDVQFLAILLDQLEAKLGLDRPIGIEVLIEEAEGLENVEAIARASPRVDALIFGMGDYSASQRIDIAAIGPDGGYPGDLFHYARFRIAMAAHAAGLDPIDGPFAHFRDEAAYREEARRARAVGMTGKWAIHPAQIAPALEVFSPPQAEVDNARRLLAAFDAALDAGQGSIAVDGHLVDIASARVYRGIVALADRIGMP